MISKSRVGELGPELAPEQVLLDLLPRQCNQEPDLM